MDIKTALQQHPFETKGKPGSELTVGTVLDLPPGVVNFEVLKNKGGAGTEPINRRLAELLEGKVKLVIRSSNFIVAMSRPQESKIFNWRESQAAYKSRLLEATQH